MSGGEFDQMKASQEGTSDRAGIKTPTNSGLVHSVDKEILFQPWTLGKYTLKHRICYAPLTRCRATLPGHVLGDNAVEYCSQRARGSEGGLIITKATVISETGHG